MQAYSRGGRKIVRVELLGIGRICDDCAPRDIVAIDNHTIARNNSRKKEGRPEAQHFSEDAVKEGQGGELGRRQ